MPDETDAAETDAAGTDAEALHAETFLLDAHSDVLYSVVRERALGRTGVIEAEFLPGMRAGGIDSRVAAVYVDESYLPEMAVRRCLTAIEALHAEVEETPALELATTASELRRGGEPDTTTLLLGLEGAEPLQDDVTLLDAYHRLGVRLLTLTHSRRNQVGDGSTLGPARSGQPSGLSAFGVEVVERSNELGVVLDLSHLNEPGFRDALEFSEGPVVASHSNCRALTDTPRNLTDDQLRAVADRDGVVGAVAVAPFVDASDPTLEAFVDHVEHAVDVAGVEHVGLGFDYYEYVLQYLSESERARLPDHRRIEGLEDDRSVGNLAPALLERGFSRREVELLYGENFLRVFEAVLGG